VNRLAAAASVGTAVLCVALGIHDACRLPPPDQRRPAWAPHLAPLATAPIAPGSAVALLGPPALMRSADASPLLYEAAWQRPDVRWALLDHWPASSPCRELVVVGDAAAPPGWAAVWRYVDVVLYERAAR
jgi:hypothetical protein